MRKFPIHPIVALVALSLPSTVLAQTGESPAERDFEAGKAAELRGAMDEACKLYRSSLAQQRVVGPLSRSARCDAREGHYRDAVAKLDEALASANVDDARRAELQAERAQSSARLARVTLTLKPGAPAIRATLDDQAAPPWGQTTMLDPGPHVVRVDCCGEPLEKRLELAAGSSTAIALPFGDPIGPVVVPGSAGTSPWMIGGIVSFAVGGAAIVATAVTGAMILNEDSNAEDLCLPTRKPGCDEAIENGEALLGPNLALWIVSGVAVAAGVTFVIVDATRSSPAGAPPGTSAALRVAPGSIAFAGSF